MRRNLILALSLMAVVGMTPKTAAAQPTIKGSIKCRDTISQKVSGLIKTGLKVVDACHPKRDKGSLTVDCNVFEQADLAGKFASAVPKVVAAYDKKCTPNDPVRANYPNGLEDVFAVIEEAIESNSEELLGSPAIVGDKVAAKCHKALVKARTSIVLEIVKLATKCQKAEDKAAATFADFAALAPNCLAAPVKSGPKAATAVCKACGGPDKLCGGADDLPAATVDGCAPLPTCLIESATQAGQLLSAAIFGLCGDGVVESGEGCDDGNLVDGDGCDSNCTSTACGNGIATQGEQCDDGNALTTDACVNCLDAVCGDGFVQAGVEVCGDDPGSLHQCASGPEAGVACSVAADCDRVCVGGPTPGIVCAGTPSNECGELDSGGTCPVVACRTNFCLEPSPLSCGQTECVPGATTRTVTVSIAPVSGATVSGLTVVLDYPEAKVRVPGFAGGGGVDARVTVVPTGGFSTKNDREYEVEVQFAGSDAIPAGPFFTVTFDDCDAATAPTLDEFGCIPTAASDPQGAPVGVTCSVSLQ